MKATNEALIVVDMQKDFMDDGALPVRGAYEIIGTINEWMDRFDLVLATQDWHPTNHGSFASNHEGASPGEIRQLAGLDQIMWPDHCVQHTDGAEFVEGLNTEQFTEIFQKGRDPEVDSYSGFYDNAHRNSTGLASYLKGKKIDAVYICGVATDYCVKFTVLDALQEGFETFLIRTATAGVNQNPGDVEKAIEAMNSAGAQIVDS